MNPMRELGAIPVTDVTPSFRMGLEKRAGWKC